MNAVCLVIDRLHAGHLGSYGNSWIETPTFDRLSAEGFLFDQAWIDHPRLDRLYRSFWLGRHAMEPATIAGPTLAELATGQGTPPILMTDDPAVAGHPLAAGFRDVLELETPGRARVAKNLDETHLARCFMRLIQWLESPPKSPFLLWCHLRGLSAPWDAPMDFRLAYADEDDPTPPDTAEVPDRMLPAGFDPDELLGITQAYAGQVTLLDRCLGAVVEMLADTKLDRQTLLAIVSARGFPLGEHRRVGVCDEALHAELVRVPMLLRFPDGLGAGGRSQAFVQPGDLWATLLDWLGVAHEKQGGIARPLLPLVRQDADSLRDRVAVLGPDGQRAILTPAWYLRESDRPQLYVHPDDFWQVNDVSDRCPQVVDLLREAASRYEQALQSDSPVEPAPLEEVLIEGMC